MWGNYTPWGRVFIWWWLVLALYAIYVPLALVRGILYCIFQPIEIFLNMGEFGVLRKIKFLFVKKKWEDYEWEYTRQHWLRPGYEKNRQEELEIMKKAVEIERKRTPYYEKYK